MKNVKLVHNRVRAILDFLIANPDYQLNGKEWLVFLTVAMDEGVTAPSLVEKLQIPQQTLSRTIRTLSLTADDEDNLQGHDLIKIIPKGNPTRSINKRIHS